MGVEGTLDFISNFLWNMKRKSNKRQISTVSLKIRMDCEGCARKVKHVLSRMKGAKSVEVDLKQQKATVTGFVEARKVLAKAKTMKKKVEIWPYQPYTVAAHPYISQAYDKKAPANHVRKVPVDATIKQTTLDDNMINMFSDDNPNACSIM